MTSRCFWELLPVQRRFDLCHVTTINSALLTGPREPVGVCVELIIGVVSLKVLKDLLYFLNLRHRQTFTLMRAASSVFLPLIEPKLFA